VLSGSASVDGLCKVLSKLRRLLQHTKNWCNRFTRLPDGDEVVYDEHYLSTHAIPWHSVAQFYILKWVHSLRRNRGAVDADAAMVWWWFSVGAGWIAHVDWFVTPVAGCRGLGTLFRRASSLVQVIRRKPQAVTCVTNRRKSS
jgi:hypothetical protein